LVVTVSAAAFGPITGPAAYIGLAGLLTNIVTFLPTLIALRAWSLPKDLTSDQYTDWLVEFMMRGLGLLRLERDN
jgi:hypothetical protein